MPLVCLSDCLLGLQGWGGAGAGEAGLFCWVGRAEGEHQGWDGPLPAIRSMVVVQSVITTGPRAYAQYNQEDGVGCRVGAQRMP